MSDQWEPDTDTVPSQSVQDTPQSSGVSLRIGGFPHHRELRVGDITITREPQEVPADKLEDIFAAARAAGYRLEVEPQ